MLAGSLLLPVGRSIASNISSITNPFGPYERVLPGLLHSWAVSSFFIRCAVISEQRELEALQLRASLTNAGDRDALLDHPDAIELPIDQIARRQGSAALCVIGNPHAYDFYSACGFKMVGTTETRFGPGLLMRKTV